MNEEDKDILALDYIPEHRMDKLIVEYLSAEDKEVADKAALRRNAKGVGR